MKPFLGASAEIRVGEPTVIESDAQDYPRGVVFEDDGETGYFYARDYSVEGSLFVDALHVYTVKGVKDAYMPSTLRIIWTYDWQKAALLINDVPHAMFDFGEKCGYSKDEFPEAHPKTGWTRRGWKDELRDYFYPKGEQ